MKRTEPQLVASLIDRVMYEGDNSQKMLEQRAAFLWGEVVGPVINRQTFRRFVADGVLHVYILSAPLKNELSFHRQRLAEAINRAMGRDVVTDIIIH